MERWLKAVLYNCILPGLKPVTLFNCFLKSFVTGSPINNPRKYFNVFLIKKFIKINGKFFNDKL